jgi:hypothetical protein
MAEYRSNQDYLRQAGARFRAARLGQQQPVIGPQMTPTRHQGFLGDPLTGGLVTARTVPYDGENERETLQDPRRAAWPSR